TLVGGYGTRRCAPLNCVRRRGPPGFEPGMADLQSVSEPQEYSRKDGKLGRSVPGSYTSAEKIKLATRVTDLDLARLVAAWPSRPEPIRRAMLALVASTGENR